jgi:hypothetical protein
VFSFARQVFDGWHVINYFLSLPRDKTKLKVIERPRDMQRRAPSLPTMPWHDEGR